MFRLPPMVTFAPCCTVSDPLKVMSPLVFRALPTKKVPPPLTEILWMDTVESTLTDGVKTASSVADGTTPPTQVPVLCQPPPPGFAVMVSARLAEAHTTRLKIIRDVRICFVFIWVVFIDWEGELCAFSFLFSD